MNKIYIAGCGGMLGEAFYKKFKDSYSLRCTDIDLNENWLSYLDFRNYQAYLKDVQEFQADYLFHLGAYTDLEFCETHVDDTYETNNKSVEHAVKISNRLSIPLLYISTAGIFDGKKDFYDETDAPNPIGHYAKSKYFGEKFILENSKQYLICRAGWMMGGGPLKDKKFIQKIMHQIKSGAKQLNIVNDKLGTPTYTHDFASNVKLLLEKEEFGLFNMVCGGLTGRVDIAKELVALLGFQNIIKINEVDSNYFHKEYFAPRPDCERLLNKKLDERNLNIMRDWKSSLKEYINNYYRNYI